MARSLQQQLDDLDAAIARVETSAQSSTSAGGRALELPSLKDMHEERRRLEMKLDRQKRGGIGRRRW